MRNPKEVALYNALRKLAPGEPRHPGSQEIERIARELAIPYKQLLSWLEKWTSKGWWNCGVVLEGGWFEPEAPPWLSETGAPTLARPGEELEPITRGSVGVLRLK